MNKNGVTINDVARRGGVSKVTVSYVLNDRQTGIRISDQTRQRVLAAAKELGYHPNALARGLARRQMDTLTLVLQSPNILSGWTGFINELMHGVSVKARELGYDLMLHTKEQPDLDHEVAALTDGRADGALLLRDLDDPLAQELSARGFPTVQIFSRSTCAEVCFADCDNVAGARLAVEHLLSLGHRRIGFIGGSARSAAAVDRGVGYSQTLVAHGIEPGRHWQCTVKYARGDFAPFLEMMAGDDAPTAVFAWSDDVAVRAMRLLGEKLGRRVPEDVAFVGFDGAEVCEHTLPRLSSIRQPIDDIAARGVEMLVAQIRQQPLAEKQVLFAPTLVVRDSCGAK